MLQILSRRGSPARMKYEPIAFRIDLYMRARLQGQKVSVTQLSKRCIKTDTTQINPLKLKICSKAHMSQRAKPLEGKAPREISSLRVIFRRIPPRSTSINDKYTLYIMFN